MFIRFYKVILVIDLNAARRTFYTGVRKWYCGVIEIKIN